jgi:hypothetical protein
MALRTLTDEDGTTWSVWDVTPQTPQVDGMRNGWLCFECAAEKRRLSPAPARWHELSDADLLALLHTARKVKPSLRSVAAAEGA